MTPDQLSLLYMVICAALTAAFVTVAIFFGPRLAKHVTKTLATLGIACAIAAALPLVGTSAVAAGAGVAGAGLIVYAVGYDRTHSPRTATSSPQTNKRNT